MLAISHFVAVTCAHTLLSAYACVRRSALTVHVAYFYVSFHCAALVTGHFTVPSGSFVRVRYSGPTGAVAVCGHVLLLFLLAH